MQRTCMTSSTKPATANTVPLLPGTKYAINGILIQSAVVTTLMVLGGGVIPLEMPFEVMNP